MPPNLQEETQNDGSPNHTESCLGKAKDPDRTCQICEKQISSKQNLKTHKKNVHQNPGQADYICTDCNKCFKTKSSLIYHRKTHIDQDLVVCNTCGAEVKNLKGHIETVHPSEERLRDFVCKLCNSQLKSSVALHNHVKGVHASEEESVVCELCGRKLKTQGYLRKHMKVELSTRAYARNKRPAPRS